MSFQIVNHSLNFELQTGAGRSSKFYFGLHKIKAENFKRFEFIWSKRRIFTENLNILIYFILKFFVTFYFRPCWIWNWTMCRYNSFPVPWTSLRSAMFIGWFHGFGVKIIVFWFFIFRCFSKLRSFSFQISDFWMI